MHSRKKFNYNSREPFFCCLGATSELQNISWLSRRRGRKIRRRKSKVFHFSAMPRGRIVWWSLSVASSFGSAKASVPHKPLLCCITSALRKKTSDSQLHHDASISRNKKKKKRRRGTYFVITPDARRRCDVHRKFSLAAACTNLLFAMMRNEMFFFLLTHSCVDRSSPSPICGTKKGKILFGELEERKTRPLKFVIRNRKLWLPIDVHGEAKIKNLLIWMIKETFVRKFPFKFPNFPSFSF